MQEKEGEGENIKQEKEGEKEFNEKLYELIQKIVISEQIKKNKKKQQPAIQIVIVRLLFLYLGDGWKKRFGKIKNTRIFRNTILCNNNRRRFLLIAGNKNYKSGGKKCQA